MQVGAESAGPQITIGADPRITRCGAVLRRFKLDELPQFFNVLVGQMSVVGPRPEVPKYVDIYSEEMRCKILSVKPGITDPASIQYRGESELLEHSADPGRTYIEEIIPAKLRLGADYIERRTFCRDMAIIVKTLVIIFSRRY
jgi:lipopolysaccharide/colanic/teichoic acid biosynthesis glycosyltransferase